VLALAAAYCFFAAGLMSLLVALVQNEQRADTVNYIAAIVLGLAGGCAFPAQQLPRLIREYVSPLLPSYWITDTIRQLEFWNISAPWLWKCLAMAALGSLGMAAAAFLFRKRIEQGCKP
jgi:hypothetical protein